MHSLPIFVRLAGRAVILIGGGAAAEAKRRLLERAGARIVGEEAQAALAIVIDDEAAIARLRARGVLVNAVDRPDLCDFTLPSIVERDPVLVAIGTGGASAGLAAALRQRLEAILPAGLGRVARALHAARPGLRALYPDADTRRHAIGAMLAPGGQLDPMRDHADPAAALNFPPPPGGGGTRRRDRGGGSETVERSASSPSASCAGPTPPGGGGTACLERLVITSPDPDELTLRAARLLGLADRLYHPPCLPPAILDRARADAERIAGPAPAFPPPGLSLELVWTP